MVVRRQRQQHAHVALVAEEWQVLGRERQHRLAAPVDAGGIDAVLEVIVVGEIVEAILRLGDGEQRQRGEREGEERSDRIHVRCPVVERAGLHAFAETNRADGHTIVQCEAIANGVSTHARVAHTPRTRRARHESSQA